MPPITRSFKKQEKIIALRSMKPSGFLARIVFNLKKIDLML